MRIVAIHGLGCSAEQGWPRVAAALAPVHDLVAMRLHGSDGRTDAPPEAWGVLAQARRLARDLRPTDLLVGHSMGGTIATRVAQIARPRALVLVEPHVVPRAGFVVRPTLELGAAPSADERAAYFALFETMDTGDGSYGEWLARWDWRVLHRMAQDLARGDGGEPSWIDTVASLRVPTHVVWGGKSDDAGEDEHAHALRRLGFPFHVVQRSAHFIPSEAPDALADAIAEIARGLE